VPWVLEGGRVRNRLEIHLVNKNPTSARFRLEAHCPVPAELRLDAEEIVLPSLANAHIALTVVLERARLRPGLAIEVQITDETSGTRRRQSAAVMAPGLAAR